MGKRFLILIGAAALGAALTAVGAIADFRSVHDPRGDTTCGHEHVGNHPPPCSDSSKRNADIVRATAGHAGTRLRHTIRVVGKFQRASLAINTDSDQDCEFDLDIERGRGRSGKVKECVPPGRRHAPGRARMDFHRHSVEILFREGSIGNPQSYGWSVDTLVGPTKATAFDYVPNGHRYIRHRLAQTAGALVDSVPPDLKLSGPKRQNPQNDTYCDGYRCDVVVHMRCGHQECTARAKGRLTNVKNNRLHPDGPFVIAPAETIRTTGPEMTRKRQRKQVRKALDEGKKVKAKVTVRAKDAAGNVAIAKRTIRIAKRVRHH